VKYCQLPVEYGMFSVFDSKQRSVNRGSVTWPTKYQYGMAYIFF